MECDKYHRICNGPRGQYVALSDHAIPNSPLEFGLNNSKMKAVADLMGWKKTDIVAFDLPAGYSCPAALQCKAYADRRNGVIHDGPAQTFRCYAASGESTFTNSRMLHWRNMERISPIRTNVRAMVRLIERSFGSHHVIRMNSSGDMITRQELSSWILVARRNPDRMFYGYTKCSHFLPDISKLPPNFRINISHGGKFDHLHPEYPRTYVSNTLEDAERDHPGLKVYGSEGNCPESELAVMRGETFVLLVHGTQPAEK